MTVSRRTRRTAPVVLLLVVVGLTLLLVAAAGHHLVGPGLPGRGTGATTAAAGEVAWPQGGQAAFSISGGDVATSARDRPVPIASVTKVMTALVVLERAPLRTEADDGFVLAIGPADVADAEAGSARSESVVLVRAGDRITQRQALLALLLPSANNMARLLAGRTAGSEPAFVALMNGRAAQLGLRDTRYADASGFDPASRSTAHDQTVLARAAMQNPEFAWLVRQSEVTLPTAGTVVSTDRLLGRDGFVGVKTGSTTPAGGCFVFAARRRVGGREELVVGAVLGQRGRDPLRTAFAATERLVDSVTD